MGHEVGIPRVPHMFRSGRVRSELARKIGNEEVRLQDRTLRADGPTIATGSGRRKEWLKQRR